MRFEAEGRVEGADVETVYEIIRDRLPDLVPFMDNVAEIVELERNGRDDGVNVLNRWRANPGQVPAVARKFIKPNMLEWLDHADWSDQNHWVDWRIESAVFADMYRCNGRNAVVADGNDARIVIQGELTVDPKRLPGVPSFMARRMLPTVEAYLVSRMKPNMAALGTGVSRFLAAAKP